MSTPPGSARRLSLLSPLRLPDTDSSQNTPQIIPQEEQKYSFGADVGQSGELGQLLSAEDSGVAGLQRTPTRLQGEQLSTSSKLPLFGASTRRFGEQGKPHSEGDSATASLIIDYNQGKRKTPSAGSNKEVATSQGKPQKGTAANQQAKSTGWFCMPFASCFHKREKGTAAEKNTTSKAKAKHAQYEEGAKSLQTYTPVPSSLMQSSSWTKRDISPYPSPEKEESRSGRQETFNPQTGLRLNLTNSALVSELEVRIVDLERDLNNNTEKFSAAQEEILQQRAEQPDLNNAPNQRVAIKVQEELQALNGFIESAFEPGFSDGIGAVKQLEKEASAEFEKLRQKRNVAIKAQEETKEKIEKTEIDLAAAKILGTAIRSFNEKIRLKADNFLFGGDKHPGSLQDVRKRTAGQIIEKFAMTKEMKAGQSQWFADCEKLLNPKPNSAEFNATRYIQSFNSLHEKAATAFPATSQRLALIAAQNKALQEEKNNLLTEISLHTDAGEIEELIENDFPEAPYLGSINNLKSELAILEEDTASIERAFAVSSRTMDWVKVLVKLTEQREDIQQKLMQTENELTNELNRVAK